MKPADVAQLARSWVGVPFVTHGRTRQGCDCLGLVLGMAREAGLIDDAFAAEFTDYELVPRRPLILREVSKRCARLPIATQAAVQIYREPRPLGGGWPALFTIAVDRAGSRIVAADRRSERVIEMHAPPQHLLHSVWALPGVEYPYPIDTRRRWLHANDHARGIHRRRA